MAKKKTATAEPKLDTFLDWLLAELLKGGYVNYDVP